MFVSDHPIIYYLLFITYTYYPYLLPFPSTFSHLLVPFIIFM